MLELRPLYRSEILLGPAQELGDTPLGRRRIIPITGGTFKGERLSGRILPGGADWQIIRRDSVAQLDARYSIETTDGALIYVHHEALRHGPPDVMKALMEGKPVDSSAYYMRGSVRFETGAAAYDWLNRILGLTRGARRAASVEVEVFEVL